IPLCAAEGVGLIPWSPLARGFLAGNRHRGGGGATTRSNSDPYSTIYFKPEDFAVAERNDEVARRLGLKPTPTARAWVLSNPAVTAPIVGATKLPHLDDALAALTIQLSTEDRAALEAPYKPHPEMGIDTTPAFPIPRE